MKKIFSNFSWTKTETYHSQQNKYYPQRCQIIKKTAAALCNEI